MSRYILKAICSTPDTFTDFLAATNYGSIGADPNHLVVFVGDKTGTQQLMSVFAASGGLYARQHFSWANANNIVGIPLNKLFFDYQHATVTLSVDLEASINQSVAFGTASAEIPKGALAVNLGSKGFQFNTSNMINEDEWGKLVYYEQGGLGLGWAFSANDYTSQNRASINTLAMYVLGGLIPDVDYQVLATSVGYQNVQAVPPYNIQIGRDQALLTQMLQTDRITGPQGYWSAQCNNMDTAVSMCGRMGGMLVTNVAAAPPNQKTFTPAFTAYNPLGFLCQSYPTACQDAGTQSELGVGWNMQFPSYGPSTQDGYMPPGNALSVPPSSFFTDYGLQLFQNTESSPQYPAVAGYTWVNYWKDATSVVHLEETRPFYIESPMFHAPINIQKIPNFASGLDLLVPITRIYNGVFLYVPVKTGVGSQSLSTVNMNGQTITDNNYFSPPLGTLQKWFRPTKVSLTLNLPFVRLDSPIQACKFFNTVTYQSTLLMNMPLWLKFRYAPNWNSNGLPVNYLDVETTSTLNGIYSAMESGSMQFVFSARSILNKLLQVLNTNGIPTTNTWGVNSLTIRKIIVSCTPVVNISRLYGVLYSLSAFNNSPQGAVLARGGTKMFSRCGPSLSHGAPTDFTVEFEDIINDRVGVMNNGIRTSRVDVSDVQLFSRGDRNNDYFNQTEGFVFSEGISIRMPSSLNDNDTGGSVAVSFKPRPVLNMPFSGEALNNPLSGGIVVKNSTIVSGELTANICSSQAVGWFNNLNPFSPDYNIIYDNPSNQASTVDQLPYLDYKMVDFTRRKIEIWIQILVPLEIYSGNPLSG